METRAHGYALLRGHGLEIGALHHPAPVPDQCTVAYCDAITKEQAIEFFPEVSPELMVEPTFLCDLDKGELRQFVDEQFDFVVLNHVIEHVANPMRVIRDLFRIVKPGGHVVIACPDKRFTFDKRREVTPFLHLALEFNAQVDQVTDEHYRDFLAGVHPQLLQLPADELGPHLAIVRARREHAHVWVSNAFHAFLVATLSIFDENTTCVFESTGDENQFEYFSVWRREPRAAINRIGDGEQISADRRAREAAEAALRAQDDYIASLEIAITRKNQHIQSLERLIEQIKAGRVLRLVQRVRRLWK